MSEASFEALRKVQLHERNYAALAKLEPDFFESYRQLLSMQRDSLHNEFSLEAAASFENIRKLLSEVLSRRQQKIFLKALRDFDGGQVGGEGLAAEEKEMYSSLIALLSSYRQQFSESLSAKRQEVPAQENNLLKVVMLSQVPQFVGVTGVIGPFGENQMAELPKEDAKLLIEQGVAKQA